MNSLKYKILIISLFILLSSCRYQYFYQVKSIEAKGGYFLYTLRNPDGDIYKITSNAIEDTLNAWWWLELTSAGEKEIRAGNTYGNKKPFVLGVHVLRKECQYYITEQDR